MNGLTQCCKHHGEVSEEEEEEEASENDSQEQRVHAMRSKRSSYEAKGSGHMRLAARKLLQRHRRRRRDPPRRLGPIQAIPPRLCSLVVLIQSEWSRITSDNSTVSDMPSQAGNKITHSEMLIPTILKEFLGVNLRTLSEQSCWHEMFFLEPWACIASDRMPSNFLPRLYLLKTAGGCRCRGSEGSRRSGGRGSGRSADAGELIP